MSDPRCIHPAPACLPSGETGDLFTARSQRRPRQPKPKGHTLAAVVCALLVGITSGTTAIARGGHGMGGFGIHGHAGGREGFLTPAYVLITISKITDAEAFKATMQDLITTTAPFAGRLAADMDKPISWDGTAAEHVAMLQFENPDQAQAWKNSNAFKKFDDELHRSSVSSMELVQGLPTAVAHGMERGRGGRGNARLDPKAFEPNVKEYDQMLTKMHGICKGC
jgi:uncharacterized protein (DUF1330 family)